MNSTELFADPELNDGVFGKPQEEQDWLRAEQEEQQWLQAEQDALSQGTNGPPNLYKAASLHQMPQLQPHKEIEDLVWNRSFESSIPFFKHCRDSSGDLSKILTYQVALSF